MCWKWWKRSKFLKSICKWVICIVCICRWVGTSCLPQNKNRLQENWSADLKWLHTHILTLYFYHITLLISWEELCIKQEKLLWIQTQVFCQTWKCSPRFDLQHFGCSEAGSLNLLILLLTINVNLSFSSLHTLCSMRFARKIWFGSMY